MCKRRKTIWVGEKTTWAMVVGAFMLHFGNNTVLKAQSVPNTVAERNHVVTELLEKQQSSAYIDVPLDSILGELQEQLGINIKLHESATDHQLELDTPIRFSLESVSLSQILSLMLEPFQCTYSIEDGVLLIVSKDYAIENPMREVLDCSELLQTIQPYSVTQRVNHYGFGGGGGGGVFRVESSPPTSAKQQTTPEPEASPATNPTSQSVQFETITVSAAEQLIELLEETIDPDSWESNGGTARVRELNGKLVIVQTAKNLREIKDLFASLK